MRRTVLVVEDKTMTQLLEGATWRLEEISEATRCYRWR